MDGWLSETSGNHLMPWKAQPHRPAGWQPRSSARDYDRRNQEDRKFYWSSQWRKLRAAFLRRPENALCGLCLERGRVEPAVDVHHVKARLDYPELALDEANLVGLCKACHSRLTRAEGSGPDVRA